MTQRDEGLDRLESFVSVAAETRSVLQREAERLADLSDETSDLGGRVDAEMKDLGTTAREIDAVVGPLYETEMTMLFGVTFGPWNLAGGYGTGRMLAQQQRRDLIAYADLLEAEYERFPERRQQAGEALDQAEAGVADARERFEEGARALEAETVEAGAVLREACDEVRHAIAAALED